ncbi:M3 family metallopeptidase [Qipengyuania sphaerica]|uniref:M3 family metallopeptidase n=1 Tax=Qipengyuania sphaerica TaxID=2867243 RepID=UPI001C8740A1|nr:M3 family metallopeptidase [Qipengyuania sphaerica]MBX7541715.1 M3 family metallopeptidase [Qipengyuania sphaerica]
MKAQILATTAAAALLSACTTAPGGEMDPIADAAVDAAVSIPKGTGYFATESTLPFKTPDFREISDEDYLPAFEQAMAIQKAEVAAIKANPAAPTFENTIVALEKSGRMLSRVSAVFGIYTGSNTNDRLKEIDTEISPALTAHYDSINLDPALFARVKAVYDNRAAMTMTPEDAALLEDTYADMVHSGALLTDAQRDRVKAINGELSRLTTEAGQAFANAMADQPVFFDTREELAGLSEADIQAAADRAAENGQPGKFALALQNTTQQPLLPNMSNRAAREKLFMASYHRADGTTDIDTRALIAQIAKLRAEKAALFGAPDWATYAMWDRMAEKPKTALDFMEQMVPPLAATQRREAAILNEAIRADGFDFEVKPWDWYRYSNRIKAEQYELDQDAMMEYFQLDKVLEDGVFYMAEKLYGLTFERRSDIPTWHPDVWTYTVFDRDGSELGLFYFDPFQRPSKRGGAWMGNLVEQTKLWGTKPVIYNVLNITKAPEGEVQLATYDNVETIFHEFGHALHGFFADQRYESLSGTNTARDFVEYPSQVHEMWAVWPEVLRNYAKHYETGETIPQAMIDKIDAASKFNQGYDFGETLEAALLDMKWAALSPAEAAALDTPEKVDAFERNALEELGLEVDLVPPRYRSTYFNHIFSSPTGYSAGYYSYLWTQMLDHDSRKWFRDNGGLTRENGDHYRATVLSRGGTMDYFTMFQNFAGRRPDVTPMLQALGLVAGDASAESGVSDDGGAMGSTTGN